MTIQMIAYQASHPIGPDRNRHLYVRNLKDEMLALKVQNTVERPKKKMNHRNRQTSIWDFYPERQGEILV